MKNFLVLFTAVIFSSVLGFSQGSKITGRIIAEENQKPIAHAHIDLMSMDSVIINQTVTGTNGRFQFQDVSEGSYRVAITHLEYEGLIFNLSVYKNTELGNISLKEKQYDIEVISVSGAGNLTRLDRELIIPAE